MQSFSVPNSRRYHRTSQVLQLHNVIQLEDAATQNVVCNESDIRFTPSSSQFRTSSASTPSTFSFHRTTKEANTLPPSSPNVTRVIKHSKTERTASPRHKNDVHRHSPLHRNTKSVVPQSHGTTMSRLRLLQVVSCPRQSLTFLGRAGIGMGAS